jgi:hypothetical protein
MDADEAPMMLPGMEINDPTDDAFFRGRLIEGDDNFQHRSTTWPEYRTKSINALGGSPVGRTSLVLPASPNEPGPQQHE